MKNLKLFIAFLLITVSANAQMTKKLKSHQFEDGTEVSIGTQFVFQEGSNPLRKGEYLWCFEGRKKMPIPINHLDSSSNNQVFVVEKLMSLKGIKVKDESIIASFKKGKKTFYVFISQSIKSKEIILK